VRYTSARLSEPVDTARRFDLTEYRLTRLGADSAPDHLLSGTNGAWGFALRVSAAQLAALLGALRGEPTAGAVPYEYPREGRTPAEHTPMVTGAYLESQTTRPSGMGSPPPRPAFPAALVGRGVAGSVRLQFVVEADGRVRPSSVRLIGKAHPALAGAARDALLAARFRPAVLAGRPVPQLTTQSFDFSQP
jgi:TonB family protein